MDSISNAKRLWKNKLSGLQEKTTTRSAVMGDGRGNAASNIEVPNAPDHVWVRDTVGNPRFYAILNRQGIAKIQDMPILLGRSQVEPELEQVIGVDYEGIGSTTDPGAYPVTLEHHQQHEFRGGDDLSLDTRQIGAGRVYPTTPASMQVWVDSFVYYWDGWKKFQTTLSGDLTRFKPITGYLVYVLIAFDPSIGQLVYRDGLPYADNSSNALYPSFDDVPAPSGNEYPLGWIFLTSTLASVDWTAAADNIGDARLHVGFPARNILDRLTQLEGLSGNDPSVALTGAALNTASDYQNRIGNLLDVAVSGATDSQALVFDAATARWVPGNAAGGGAAVSNTTPSNVGASGNAGTSASVSKGDHIHALIQNEATPANISASGLAGTSASPAHGDHVHKGVFSLVAGTGASVETSPLGTVTVGMAGSGWASAVPSREFDVVYTNGSLTRMVAISVGLKPSVTVPAEVSLRADAASPPTTEVVRLAGASGLGASVTGEATALIMPNERYWLKNNTGVGGLAEITKWIEYDDFGGAPAPEIVNRVFNGRLTLDGSNAISTSGITSGSIVYVLPSNGDQISLYTPASVWNTIRFTSASLGLTGLSPNSVYDIWGYKNVSEITLETTRWNVNNTIRTAGLSAQDGVWTQASNRTRVLLGTIYMGGTCGMSADSSASRFLYNVYNQAQRSLSLADYAPHTYNLNVYRAYNNSTANRVQAVLGLAAPVTMGVLFEGRAATAGNYPIVQIGTDSTTVNDGTWGYFLSTGTEAITAQFIATQNISPGFHFFQTLELFAIGGSGTFSTAVLQGWLMA